MPAHFAKYDSNHQAADLFNIVADVERYPEFLPWVSAVRITEKHDDHFIADLRVNFKGISHTYTSRVELTRPNKDHIDYKINVRLVKGPFKHLRTEWIFIPKDSGTEIVFELELSFSSAMFEKMLGYLFEKAVMRMTDAFIKRADEILIRKLST